MKTKWMVLTLAILAVALIPAAYADCGCENAKAEETVIAEASGCGGGGEAHAGCSGDCGDHAGGSCSGDCAAAEVAKMVEGAESGCEASMGALIAMAKKSTDAETVSLADHAENGCEQSQAALIALAKDWSKTETADGAGPTKAQLAERASHGCEHSKAALIALAQESDNAEEAALATRAAGGCQHSTDALIALAKTDATQAEGN
jgi:hypothetical protein